MQLERDNLSLWTERTARLIGQTGVERLATSRVAIFGLGGVGSYVAEGLARAGVGNFFLVDGDTVDVTNLNRQIIATTASIGKSKVEVMTARIKEINPAAKIVAQKKYFLPETAKEIFFSLHDIFGGIEYVIDAIDMVAGKIALVLAAEESHIPIISAMGTGNKLDPAKFQVADIYETSVCPLARIMRRELKKRGIKSLPVVYSREVPHCEVSAPSETVAEKTEKISTVGSISFVPAVAGLIIAGKVTNDLLASERPLREHTTLDTGEKDR